MAMLLIKNRLTHNAVDRNPFIADILVGSKKVVKIEPDMFWDGAEIYDAVGSEIYPDFVEAHTHTGLSGHGISCEGHDYNGLGDIISPQLHAIDGIEPRGETSLEARNTSVTILCVDPGSANVLGGTFTTIKSVGCRMEQMCLKKEVAIECAFGENPERNYKEKGNFDHMTTAARLRDVPFRARGYEAKLTSAGDHIADRPPFDMKLQAMLPVLRKEVPLKAHTHQIDDFFTIPHIAREFDVDIMLEHVTKGHLIAEGLAEEDVMLAMGPALGRANKFELGDRIWDTPGVLAARGCHISIITDAPFIPQQYLILYAGLTVKAGMDESEALKAIAIHPAEHIGVAHRVGSLEVGKDTDIVVTDGNPFDIQTNILSVFVNGRQMSFCRG